MSIEVAKNESGNGGEEEVGDVRLEGGGGRTMLGECRCCGQ